MRDYRGLWGLDTGDRLAGERAPAGPKYTRTGTVRQSWNDPLGFVGLASFLAIFVVLLRRLNRARRRWQATRPELADLATAFTFSLLGWLGTSAFLHLSYQRFLWFLVALPLLLRLLSAAQSRLS